MVALWRVRNRTGRAGALGGLLSARYRYYTAAEMWLFTLSAAHGQVVAFDLSDAIALQGDARMDDAKIVLTGDQLNSAGAAWIDVPFQIPAGGGFHAFFEARLAPSGGFEGGLVFVLQAERRAAFNAGTDSLGYEGISPSLGVEFDVWKSIGADDPNGEHIGLDIDGDLQSLVTAPSPVALGSGDGVYVWVDYAAGELRVTVSDSDTREGGPSLIWPIALPPPSSTLWVGFTASAGTASARDVRAFTFIADGDADGDGQLDYEEEEEATESGGEEQTEQTSELSDTGLVLPRIFFCGCSSSPAIAPWTALFGLFCLSRRRRATWVRHDSPSAAR